MNWAKPLVGLLLLLQGAPLWASMPVRHPVDPMTGAPLSYEDKLHRPEELRLETQIRREAAKRARAETALARQPHKKRLAVGRLAGRTAAAGRAQRAYQATGRRVRRLAVAEAAARRLPQAPTLVGVMKLGREFVALVSYRGQTVNAPDGGRVGNVTVTAIDDSSARLNGRRYVVQPQAGTIAIVDEQPPALSPLTSARLVGTKP